MASSNNLDALSQDGDLPFGHPGPNFDDTPEGFEPSPLVDQILGLDPEWVDRVRRELTREPSVTDTRQAD